MLNKIKSNSKIIKEGLLVSITEYFMLGTIFFVTIFLNRFYGSDVLGDFSFSYSLSQIIIFGIGTAFSPLLRRELTLSLKNKNNLINNILHYRIILLALVLLLSIPFLFIYNNNYLLYVFAILATSKGLDLFSDTFYTYYQSVNEFKIYSILKCGHAISLTILITTAVFLELSKEYIYFSFLISSILFFFINIVYVHLKRIIKLSLKGFFSLNLEQKAILKDVWPIIINAVIFQLKSRASVLIVFFLLGSTVTGVYSSILITITVFTALSSPLGIVLFPGLNKIFSEDSSLLKIHARNIIINLFLIGVMITIFYFITLKLQIMVLGDLPDYSTKMFVIMGLSIPSLIAIGGVGNIFVILNKQKEAVLLGIINLVITVVLFYGLIHFFEIIGLAIAFLITSFLNLLSLYYFFLYLLNKMILNEK